MPFTLQTHRPVISRETPRRIGDYPPFSAIWFAELMDRVGRLLGFALPGERGHCARRDARRDASSCGAPS